MLHQESQLMTRKQKLILRKTASLKNTSLLGILFLIMSCFIIPDANKQIQQYAPETGLIDFLIYYSPDQLYQMISAYGKQGRQLYIVVELSADFIFSIVIAAFFSSFLIWSDSKLKTHFIKIEYYLLFPIIFMLANFLENLGIIWFLSNYPTKSFFLASVTSIFTFSKWISILLCLGIIAWNLIQIAMSKINHSSTIENKF